MFKHPRDPFRIAITILVASTLPICAAAQSTAQAQTTGLEDLVGTWKLGGESRYGDLLHILVVAGDGTATYESNGQVSEVRNLEVNDGEVRFNMTVFGGPGSYDLAFAGSINAEGLTGDILSNGGSFASVNAPRRPDLSGLIGVWKLTGTSQYGPMEHELVVAADGTATYASNGEVSDVTDLEIDGDKVRFDMTVWGGSGSYDMSFAGSFDEAGLTGDLLTGEGDSFAILTAPRQVGE